ncbi:hypothetical protein IAT40_001737 [Kwoniella sp. CBS 6097]
MPTPRSTLTHIGAWKLGRTLGRGAYAHVRLATHETGHQAACKILPALHHTPGQEVSWDQTVDAIEAHKEVVLLKALSGANVPGIVGLEGVIEQGGWTYVFLALHRTSASRIPPPWNRTCLIPFFRHLLHSVNALHSLNVSHEDLKRSNILIGRDDLPSLVDFGFSHFKPCGGWVRSAGGTLDYSSPEKTADEMYDPKANDVWSLGIILIKLLNFPHPYSRPDETSTAVKQRIIGHLPYYHFPKEARKPGGVAQLIEGMLERDPTKRWKISKILRHPCLQTDFPGPGPYSVPPKDLSFMHRIPITVVEDICFLAHLNGEFALCETTRKIEDKLTGKEPCWEKQWAGMLSAWSKRAEMDWEPIPMAITPLRAKSDPTNNRRAMKSAAKTTTTKPQALREIHLSPNRHMRTPVRDIPGGLENQQNKENIPPKRARKSRMYGMKTRDESMVIDPVPIPIKGKSERHDEDKKVPQTAMNKTVTKPSKRNKNANKETKEGVNIAPSETKKTSARKRTKKLKVFEVVNNDSRSLEEVVQARSGSVTLPSESASGTLTVDDDSMVIDPSTRIQTQQPRLKTMAARAHRAKGSTTAVTRAKAKNARSPTPETQVQDTGLAGSIPCIVQPDQALTKQRPRRSLRLAHTDGIVGAA